jgi:hypothetical protein
MELGYIKKDKQVPATFASLGSSLDTCEVRHVGGRLQHASIPYFTKHPVILDPSSKLPTMLIREVNEALEHASTEFTLHDLRQQYHVVRLRAFIRRIVQDCST